MQAANTKKSLPKRTVYQANTSNSSRKCPSTQNSKDTVFLYVSNISQRHISWTLLSSPAKHIPHPPEEVTDPAPHGVYQSLFQQRHRILSFRSRRIEHRNSHPTRPLPPLQRKRTHHNANTTDGHRRPSSHGM